MEWTVAILGVVGSLVVAYFTAEWRARHERMRLREELKLEYSVEAAIRHLLDESGWELRSLDAIKHHIRGFADDRLREYLVRSGAIAFENDNGEERWGLLQKNRHRLASKRDNR